MKFLLYLIYLLKQIRFCPKEKPLGPKFLSFSILYSVWWATVHLKVKVRGQIGTLVSSIIFIYYVYFIFTTLSKMKIHIVFVKIMLHCDWILKFSWQNDFYKTIQDIHNFFIIQQKYWIIFCVSIKCWGISFQFFCLVVSKYQFSIFH